MVFHLLSQEMKEEVPGSQCGLDIANISG